VNSPRWKVHCGFASPDRRGVCIRKEEAEELNKTGATS
jgi:hypothetical protein